MKQGASSIAVFLAAILLVPLVAAAAPKGNEAAAPPNIPAVDAAPMVPPPTPPLPPSPPEGTGIRDIVADPTVPAPAAQPIEAPVTMPAPPPPPADEGVDADGRPIPGNGRNTGNANGRGAAAKTGGPGGNGPDRRSAVANAVQAMLQVADRNGGIGEQVRVIARNQTQGHERIEADLAAAGQRGKLAKFFLGPDYRKLADADQQLKALGDQFTALESAIAKTGNEADAAALREQLRTLVAARDELGAAVAKERKGFALFGWLNRWLAT